MKNIQQGNWNPARVFEALGKIGYQPVSAIMDIIDNSVSANASSVDVDVRAVKIKAEGKGKAKTEIEMFLISDDGKGMTKPNLENALSLGSPDSHYESGTLSKFGMGMKSAASSLGRRLEILSWVKGSSPVYAILDHDLIAEKNDYVYEIGEFTSSTGLSFDTDSLMKTESGTILCVTKIKTDSMPSIGEILETLQNRLGVTYHYFIDGKVKDREKLKFTIRGEEAKSLDPLFVDEIDNKNGNLDESTWSGKDVKWITTPQKIQLSLDDPSMTADVAITQLPHPPTVNDDGSMTAKECRDKYLIGAGNYGFYIYRNHRLIAWADSLEKMIGQEVDLYSFRGRLNITSDSDEILNIDVTKSHIHLSEIAKDQLKPIVNEAKKKSMEAWRAVSKKLQSKISQAPHDSINEKLDQISKTQEKDDEIEESISSKEERKKLQQRRDATTTSFGTTKEESVKLGSQGQRVQQVNTLDNNELWKMGHDPEHGLMVKVNESHRFFKELLSGQGENAALIKVLDVLFYALARGEYETLYKSEFDDKLSAKILTEYRERVGGALSDIVKKLNAADINS